MVIPQRILQSVLNSGREAGRTVWGPKVPTLQGTEASLSSVRCFLYLVSSSVKASIFHMAWLDTSWTGLAHPYITCGTHAARRHSAVKERNTNSCAARTVLECSTRSKNNPSQKVTGRIVPFTGFWRKGNTIQTHKDCCCQGLRVWQGGWPQRSLREIF